jgi:hypothetical protein
LRQKPDLEPISLASILRMNEPLKHAREQLREEFEQLRGEIRGLGGEQGGGGDPPSGGGFRHRARASLAVLALSAAVAAAAGTFGLNGGRTSRDGSVSVPPSSSEPEPGVTTADRGSAGPSPFSLVGSGLLTDILGSNAELHGAGHPSTGQSALFVVGDPISASGHGSPGGQVKNADPIGHSPAATATPGPTPPAPAPEPHEPSLAFSPPPAPAGGAVGGPGGGEVPGDGGQSGDGGHTAAPALEEDDAGGGHGGPGKGLGHIKAKGKGHDGGSPGKGHEKDQEGGEVVVVSDSGDSAPEDSPAGHGHGHGQAKGKGRGGGPPTPPPPGPGPKGNAGSGEGPDAGHGKSTAPGQVGK